MSTFLTNNCDGAGPHIGPPMVRVYPLGAGGNLILCRACWNRENAYRQMRAREQNAPDKWPTLNWDTAETYAENV